MWNRLQCTIATSSRISWHANTFAHTSQFVSAKLILVTSSREHSYNSAIFLQHAFHVSRFPPNRPQLSIMTSANCQQKTSEIFFLVCYCTLRFARLLVGAHWNNGIVRVLQPTQLIQRQNSHCSPRRKKLKATFNDATVVAVVTFWKRYQHRLHHRSWHAQFAGQVVIRKLPMAIPLCCPCTGKVSLLLNLYWNQAKVVTCFGHATLHIPRKEELLDLHNLKNKWVKSLVRVILDFEVILSRNTACKKTWSDSRVAQVDIL